MYKCKMFFDTICNATQDRQKEASELSQRVDMMIIIGGSQSSNTAKLKGVCEKKLPDLSCGARSGC